MTTPTIKGLPSPFGYPLTVQHVPLTAPRRLHRALDGLEPAEVLPPAERDRLMRILCGYGWTDVQIAVHTLWSTYTVGRIRERLGLAANVQKGAA